MDKKIITQLTGPISEPFQIPVGGQVTLLAQGLQATDRVIVEVVTTTSSAQGMDVCCPGPVALPEVATAVPLRCRNGARAMLTPQYPWLVLDAPQDVELRARLIADDLAIVTVMLGVSDSAACHPCECREPYQASYPVRDAEGNLLGYAFVSGAEEDPEATALLETLAPTVHLWLYPDSRPGASVPIFTTGGALAGYAVNP